MTIAYWCVLAAGLLPYIAITFAKWDKTYLRGNAAPREWEAQLQGMQSSRDKLTDDRSKSLGQVSQAQMKVNEITEDLKRTARAIRRPARH